MQFRWECSLCQFIPQAWICVTIAIYGQGFIAIVVHMQGFFTIYVHKHGFFLMLASNDSLIMLLVGDPFVTVGAGDRSECLGRERRR